MKLSKAQGRMVIYLHQESFMKCGKRLGITERWCIRNNLVYINPAPVTPDDLSGCVFRLTDYGKVVAKRLTGEMTE